MTAITHSLYERYILRVDTTRLDDLRALLPGPRTNALHSPVKPGYTAPSPPFTNPVVLEHQPGGPMPAVRRMTVLTLLVVAFAFGVHTPARAQMPVWQTYMFPQVFLGTPGAPNDWQAYLSVTAGQVPTSVTIYVKTESEPEVSPGVDRSQLWYVYTDQLAANERKSYHLNHIFWFRVGKQVQAGGTVRLICDFACTASIGQHHAAPVSWTAEDRARVHWQGAFVLTGERPQ